MYKTIFFYIDSSGQKKELPYYTPIDLRDNKSNQEIIICYKRENGVTTDKKTKEEKRFEIMLGSSIKDLDSIANKSSMRMWDELNK